MSIVQNSLYEMFLFVKIVVKEIMQNLSYGEESSVTGRGNILFFLLLN